MKRGSCGRVQVFSDGFADGVGQAISQWDIGERMARTMERFGALGGVCTSEGEAGFLWVDAGGMPHLWRRRFRSRGWPRSTFMENLDAWEERGVICVYRGPASSRGGRRPVRAIEIPLLTENLVWAARHLREARRYFWCAGIGLTDRMVTYLTLDSLRRRSFPPTAIEHPRDYLAVDHEMPPIIKAARSIEAIERHRAGGCPHPFDAYRATEVGLTAQGK
jgi:hypothetical protein